MPSLPPRNTPQQTRELTPTRVPCPARHGGGGGARVRPQTALSADPDPSAAASAEAPPAGKGTVAQGQVGDKGHQCITQQEARESAENVHKHHSGGSMTRNSHGRFLPAEHWLAVPAQSPWTLPLTVVTSRAATNQLPPHSQVPPAQPWDVAGSLPNRRNPSNPSVLWHISRPLRSTKVLRGGPQLGLPWVGTERTAFPPSRFFLHSEGTCPAPPSCPTKWSPCPSHWSSPWEA